ncbi:SLATT domain-containing protein [Rhizobium laguerreae]|uniref:SLATT domain-containing protein n=1 Tax=Rhizobium laguerreae TaxID=1076926 RepID=UPI001478C6C1|nr:SLATT domain-containing protein [Rhizobium laguerreae]NNH57532.1 SLATT domain-containing protein [Rhizobium laguerreae]
MSDTITDFNRSLKATAGARFKAAKRLEHIDKRMTALTSFSSAYLILLSVGPSLMGASAVSQPITNLFSTALSVLLLASSVLSYASGHAVRSEQYRRSALEIQEIRRELRFAGDNVTQELFSTLSHRYDAVLQKYSINHDDVDFYRYQLQYPKEYIMNRFDRFEKSAKVFMAYSYPAMILLLLTGAVFLFTLFLIVWGGDAGRFLEWAALRFS